MKILSLNIWDLPFWFVPDRRVRVEKIVDYILAEDLDVVCLQESWDVGHRQLMAERLRSAGYYSTMSKPGELSSELPRVKASRRILFLKKFDTTGGLVIFSKFPLSQVRFTAYSGWRNLSPVEFFSRKGFLEADLETPNGVLHIVTTHLHQPGKVADRRMRLHQTGILIKNLIAQPTAQTMPTVLAGDFNQHQMLDDVGFRTVLTDIGGFNEAIVDSPIADPLVMLESARLPTYRPENAYVALPMNRIPHARRFDYILVKNLEALGAYIKAYAPHYLLVPLSDHDPVLLHLQLG